MEETREFAKMVLAPDLEPVFEVNHARSYRVQPVPLGVPDELGAPAPESDPDFKLRPPVSGLLGSFVVLPGGTAVAPQRAYHLAALLVDPRSYTGTVAGCIFSPTSVVRFRGSTGTVDFYFDAGCDDAAVVANDRRVIWHGMLAAEATATLSKITEDLAHPYRPLEDEESPEKPSP